ncbi:MAG: transposase [Deltaproteobacteria bacterium]|nr:transposase [Deltaproteobacteria bacterium]
MTIPGMYESLPHVHLPVSIPPKYAVSQIAGYIKGKSTIHIARAYAGCRRNFMG